MARAFLIGIAFALIAAAYVSIGNYNVTSCHQLTACTDAGR